MMRIHAAGRGSVSHQEARPFVLREIEGGTDGRGLLGAYPLSPPTNPSSPPQPVIPAEAGI